MPCNLSNNILQLLHQIKSGVNMNKLLKFFESKSELARFCGVSRHRVNNWYVSGAIPVKFALKLSDHTGVDLAALNSVFKGYKLVRKNG